MFSFLPQLAEPELEQVWVEKNRCISRNLPTIVRPGVSSQKYIFFDYRLRSLKLPFSHTVSSENQSYTATRCSP